MIIIIINYLAYAVRAVYQPYRVYTFDALLRRAAHTGDRMSFWCRGFPPFSLSVCARVSCVSLSLSAPRVPGPVVCTSTTENVAKINRFRCVFSGTGQHHVQHMLQDVRVPLRARNPLQEPHQGAAVQVYRVRPRVLHKGTINTGILLLRARRNIITIVISDPPCLTVISYEVPQHNSSIMYVCVCVCVC